jgi:hypothetical protein
MARLQLNVFFQQDGARDSEWSFFKQIWREGPKPWSHHSPSITPLDFFLWGCVRDQAFRPKVSGVVELHARINNEVASLKPQILKNIWCEMEYSLDILQASIDTRVEL